MNNQKLQLKSSAEIAFDKFEKSFKKMSKQEVLKTFVDAGILTEKGNVRKPYRNALKKVSKPTLKSTPQ